MEEEITCGICEKVIDENKDDYEETTNYLQGNFEEMVFVHTDCRYKVKRKLRIIEKKYKLVSNLLKKFSSGKADGDLDWIINVATDEEIEKMEMPKDA